MFEFVHKRHQRGCFREPTVSRDKPMRFLFGPMGLCSLSSFLVFALGVFLFFRGMSGGIHPFQSSDGTKDSFECKGSFAFFAVKAIKVAGR